MEPEPTIAPQETPEPEMREVAVAPTPAIGVGGAAIYHPRPQQQITAVLVYDTSDKTAPVLTRVATLDGILLSSRMVGDCLYLAANQYCYDAVTPCYSDSVRPGGCKTLPLKDIRYFPDVEIERYLNVAGMDLSRADSELHIESFLGAGDDIYVSQNNLYVAGTQYRFASMPEPVAERLQTAENREQQAADMKASGAWAREQVTDVFKFSLNNGVCRYETKGTVPGSVLNQFSMDESDGFFRIATTQNEWADGQSSNLFVLDGDLREAGSIRGIAPGERIYACRFIGGRGYMVTYKTTDPLFVLDLSDPHQPQILGELKIPGFSNYLHPYDETHLIGFGKDSVEIPHKSGSGEILGVTAYDLGMKIAVFDVSDVANPVEQYVEYIGDRGTDSPLLSDHKALLFDRERDLLAFPVQVAEVQGEKLQNGYPAYGKRVFSGAYVYQLNLEEGFQLKQKITHQREELDSFGWTDVNRLLTIGDSLYAVSYDAITAHDSTADYVQTAELALK